MWAARRRRTKTSGTPAHGTEHSIVRTLVTAATALLAAFTWTPLGRAGAPPQPPNAAATAAPSEARPEAKEPEEPPAPDSPRASVQNFLNLGEHGQWGQAAEYLDIGPNDPRAAELARRLHDVITQSLVVDFDDLSPLSSGDANDGLPEGVDELGIVTDPEGHPVHLRLVRHRKRDTEDAARWVFSRQTLSHVDDLHVAIEDGHWITDHVPPALRARGPKGIRYWQLVAVPLIAALSVLVGWLLARGSVAVAARAFRTRGWAYRLVSRLERPLRLGWALAAFWICLPYIDLPAKIHDVLDRGVTALMYVTAFWAALHAVAIGGDEVIGSAWASDRPTVKSLSQVGVKFAKVIVIVLAVMAALARLGYPVTSVVAGFGLGGVAIALAAQKTVENLFGTLSILTDQPFRVGDVIRVDDLQGAVESIGLRSTRVRRVDGVLVIYPNGLLADKHVESLSDRDSVRMSTRLPIARTASATDLRALRAAVRTTILSHPKVLDRDISVDLCAIEESWYELEIAALIDTRSIVEFERVRGELLEACIDTATRVSVELALPSRAFLADAKRSTEP